MTGTRLIRRRIGRLAGAAGVATLAAALMVLLPAAPGSAAPATGLAVSAAHVDGGKVWFVATGHHLPAGASLDAAHLKVLIAGAAPQTTTVGPVNGGDGAAEVARRGVVLVLDAGASVPAASVTAIGQAASGYSHGLSDDVALGLVGVAGRATGLADAVPDRSVFGKGLAAFAAAGTATSTPAAGATAAPGGTGAALVDGIDLAAQMLAAIPDAVERRILVVAASDDTGSKAKPADVAGALAAANIRLDVVQVGTKPAGAQIMALAAASDGKVVPASDATLASTLLSQAAALPVPVRVTAPVPAGVTFTGQSSDISVTLTSATDKILATANPTVKQPAAAPTPEATATGAAPALADVAPASDSGGVPGWLLLVGLGLLGLAIMVGVFVPASGAFRGSKLARRLRQMDSFTSEQVSLAKADQSGSSFMRTALSMSEQFVQNEQRQSRIEAALDQAGIDLRPAEWVLLRTGLTVGGAFVGMLLLPLWWLGVIMGGFAGWLLPGVARRFRAGRRKRKFADLLPESLQLVVGALRSGFSLPQAIDALVREGPDPVAGEFGRAVAQIRLGGELEDALQRTATRNGSQDLAFLVMAIRIQREVGGNLSEVLETAVETMRERARISRHVRALSAEGRLSAYVLIALPVFVSGGMFFLRPDYVRPLYTTVPGWIMLFGAACMLSLGTFWMSRLIRVEV